MNITFDPAKRAKTLEERGLDFADAEEVFAGKTLTVEDDRLDYASLASRSGFSVAAWCCSCGRRAERRGTSSR